MRACTTGRKIHEASEAFVAESSRRAFHKLASQGVDASSAVDQERRRRSNAVVHTHEECGLCVIASKRKMSGSLDMRAPMPANRCWRKTEAVPETGREL